MSIRHVAALTALLIASPVWALNKCTGPDGKVTYSDTHCAIDSKKQEQLDGLAHRNVLPRAGGAGSGPSAPDVQPKTTLKAPPEAAQMIDLYRRWADAEKLAFSTMRIALPGPISNLQAIKREGESLAVPECLDRAKEALNTLIGKSTEAILQFAAKQEIFSLVYTRVERSKLIPQFEHEAENANCAKPF